MYLAQLIRTGHKWQSIEQKCSQNGLGKSDLNEIKYSSFKTVVTNKNNNSINKFDTAASRVE